VLGKDAPGNPRMVCVTWHDTISGTTEHHVVLRDRIERAKEASKSTDSEYSPWNTDPAAMWLKTGIVDASRFWPLSPEMAQAVQWDEQADRGERQTVETPQGEAELTSPPE